MKITIPEAAVNAVLGYAVVFFGLILLMCVVIIMGNIMQKRKATAAAGAGAAGVLGTGARASYSSKSMASPFSTSTS